MGRGTIDPRPFFVSHAQLNNKEQQYANYLQNKVRKRPLCNVIFFLWFRKSGKMALWRIWLIYTFFSMVVEVIRHYGKKNNDSQNNSSHFATEILSGT